jgi:pyridoxamine 5'-phosphate oxidase
MKLNDLREEYDTTGLGASDIGDDPIEAVTRWLEEAIDAAVPQANALALATVGPDGAPSLRTVLLKEIDHGFVFYTNTRSRKGRELTANRRVAISLTWVTVHRQIRAEGRAELVDDATADRYFASRPAGAQIAAAASPQSQVISDREWLERRVAATAAELAGAAPPRPPHWTGVRVVPDVIEFWQGRRNRLHDRIVYRRTEQGWATKRLAP